MARRLKDIPDPWLLCFVGPHAMHSHTPDPGEFEGPEWGDSYHLACDRCPTTRVVTLNIHGDVAQSYYPPTKARKEFLAARREAVTAGRGDPRLEHLRREQIRLRAERKARVARRRQ